MICSRESCQLQRNRIWFCKVESWTEWTSWQSRGGTLPTSSKFAGMPSDGADANFHRQYDRQIRLWGLAAQQRMTGEHFATRAAVLQASRVRTPREQGGRRQARPAEARLLRGSLARRVFLSLPVACGRIARCARERCP